MGSFQTGHSDCVVQLATTTDNEKKPKALIENELYASKNVLQLAGLLVALLGGVVPLKHLFPPPQNPHLLAQRTRVCLHEGLSVLTGVFSSTQPLYGTWLG